MEQSCRPVSLLASVTDESEARLCAALGADIIDAKNPALGALGALPAERVRAIRACVPAHVPVSATIGDPADDPETVARAVHVAAAAGADVVKVGFRAEVGADKTLRRLSRLALGRVRLVAVLLVDRGVDLELVGRARDAGFAGAMLDTGDKRRGALPDLLAGSALREFVDAAHRCGLFAGFAGSLRACHVRELLGFGPDVLGFRGGLCSEGERTAAIDADAVRAVRRAIPGSEPEGTAPCPAAHTSAIGRRQPEGAL
jgi:uncharacterized protein (UPF0264 family)